MTKTRKAKEVEIKFGPARVFVQYGLADAVIDLNDPDLRGENDELSEKDMALHDWAEEQRKGLPVSEHPHDVKIRVEFDSRTPRDDRLAIGNLISKSVTKKVPPMTFSSPYDEDARTQELFYFNQMGLINRDATKIIAKGSLEGILAARAQWWESQRDHDPDVMKRAAVAKAIATIMADFATEISPEKRLKAEEIIVDKLEPAMMATRRTGVSKANLAAGLAFNLDEGKKEVDKVTVRLGAIGISDRISKAINHEVGRNIFPNIL